MRYQARLSLLQRTARERKISTILVFEGWDAAGKGGAIRRMVAALEARDYQVISITKPTDEEYDHHYMWRFWRHLPSAGRFTIFDRSWYGRVLVERIEGFATEREWRRAYGEINDFERQLVTHGIVLAKFWVNITPEEQEQRFEARRVVPFKRWKLTPEDWRNRNRWRDYELAVHDMVERTSTPIAPWHIVEGNDKRYARIKILETVCDTLERALEKKPDEMGAR
jgi:polyphosphate kinase 2 (PPK2 family)